MNSNYLALDQLVADRRADLQQTADRIARRRRTPAEHDPAQFQRWSDGVAAELAASGFARLEPAVGALVARARRRNVAAVAVDVLADRTQPEIARMRAFGIVVGAVLHDDAATRSPRLRRSA